MLTIAANKKASHNFKIEEKFEFAKKENDIKDKVNDILFSVLEDDEKFVD